MPDGYDIDEKEVLERHDCNWCEWLADITLPDGRFIENGTIEGDGHMWSYESIKDENGNTVV